MMTVSIKDIQAKWMRFYLNIMVLRSHNPKGTVLLEKIQQASAEFNEKIMKFFEEMEVKL